MTDAALGGELSQLTAEYEILGELGRGGSAVVYRGRDKSLGRDVAIKVVHPRPLSPDDDAVARLAREARTVAQLQHPNIVTVFAVRRLSGGGLALVMQLVPGRTLKAVVLQDGPLPVDRCERVLRDVASALSYAHARGVVHRDVKPENIFIDEESGRALLSDFGIARSDEHDSMTLTGTAIGTPFYMSPEQIDNAAIDGRSDLYSLGLVAWEVLTGKRPWDGESLYNVIYKQKHEELPPIEALRTGVPPRLQYIVERMLQKNPAARWAGAEGLLAQLSHTVLPGDYGRWQSQLRKRVERYRAAEKERERVAAEAPAESATGIIASTIRFVRSAAGGAAKKSERDAAPTPGLADTMVVRRDATLPAPAAPPLAPPSVEEDVAVAETSIVRRQAVTTPRRNGKIATPRRLNALAAPSWARPSAARRVVRLAIALVLLAVIVGIATLIAGPSRVRTMIAAARAKLEAGPPVALDSSDVTGEHTRTTPAAPTAAESAATAIVPSTSAVTRAVLALGARHSCVVTIDGTVQCWGANERGQLGDGTAQRQVAPVHVAAELTFASVSSGSAQSCGVTRSGDVYCWGNDASGQLGDATTVRRNAPVRVAGPGIYRSVSTGDAHTCAITVEGAVHCWGANARGQVGDGSTQSRTVPTVVASTSPMHIAQVVTGSAHTCALTTDGKALCWGANGSGQLGIGASGDRRVPTPVASDVKFVALAAGQQHTCGLAEDGGVWCWGSNARGQLGIGSRTDENAPRRARLAVPALSLAAGGQHTCAVIGTGEAFCWGANGAGQLGIGSLVDSSTPVRASLTDAVTVVAAGASHTCGISVAGAVLCWGSNAEGQIGDATRTTRSVATRVAFADALPHQAAAPSPR